MKVLSLVVIAACFIGISFSSPVRAEDDARKTKIEMHEKMAALHKQAVECLKSDKSEDECRDQMRKEMPKCEGGDCPMANMMGHEGMKYRHKCASGDCQHKDGEKGCKNCKNKKCKDKKNCPNKAKDET